MKRNEFCHMNHQYGQIRCRTLASKIWIMGGPLVVTRTRAFGEVTLQYMNSSVSCLYPDLTWSPLVCPLAFSTSCPLRRSSFLWLSIIITRICPSHHRRRPSQVQLVRVSPSTRNDVSMTGRVRHLNRVIFANSRTKAPV